MDFRIVAVADENGGRMRARLRFHRTMNDTKNGVERLRMEDRGSRVRAVRPETLVCA